MLQALSDFIHKVTHGETLTIAGKKARWQKVSELTPGLMIAVPEAYEESAGVKWDEIVSIRRLPPEQVYDIEVEGTHNFVANRIFAHNTAGKALGIFNETGDQNILVASASGTTQFTVGRTGIVTAAQFQDQADTTYFLDPAATGTGLKLAGDIELTAGGTISSTANANITINAGSGTVCIGVAGTCAGKLDSGTLDPPYTINGKKYATYVPSMVGIKEELSGTVYTSIQVPGKGYRANLDFLGQKEGSDLWLFSKVTALKKHLGQMTVLLSPAANTKSWYEVDPEALRLTIFTTKPTTVSYRLSAPRFDSDQWQNARDEGSIGHIINDPDGPPASMDSQGYLDGVSLTLVKNDTGEWKLTDSVGNLIEEILTASQATIANLTVGTVKTSVLSPLSDQPGDGIAIKLSENQTFGIYTKEGSPSAVFDEKGNATFSGTLYADRIVTKFGEIGNLQTTTVSATYITNAITNITNVIASDSAAISSSPIVDATSSALLALLEQDVSSIKYQVSSILNSDTLTHDTLIHDTLLVSGPLIIGSDGISATSDTLYIEKGKTANLDIMAGTIVVNTAGDVIITGNLAVSGNVAIGGVLGVNEISPLGDNLVVKLGSPSADFGSIIHNSKFLIQDEGGNTVAVVDASGSAQFTGDVSARTLTTDKLVIRSSVDPAATTSASLSAGRAGIPAFEPSVLIRTDKVTGQSLIFITPITTTKRNLSVNSMTPATATQSGSFTVSLSEPEASSIEFNWFILN